MNFSKNPASFLKFLSRRFLTPPVVVAITQATKSFRSLFSMLFKQFIHSSVVYGVEFVSSKVGYTRASKLQNSRVFRRLRPLRNRIVAFTYCESRRIDWQKSGILAPNVTNNSEFSVSAIRFCVFCNSFSLSIWECIQ